jgi:hypothetical protein
MEHGRYGWRKGAAVALLAAAGVATAAGDARAQGPVPIDAAHMKTDMHAYFHGEKWAGPFFFGTGVAAASIGAVLLTRSDPVARGAAYPVIGLGIVQALVGAVVFFRSDAQAAKLDAKLASDPAAFKRDETARMLKVKNQFVVLGIVESVFMLGGTVTAAVAARKECCRTLQGVGLGFAAQGAATLMLDLFAAARARDYLQSLDRFDPGAAAPAPPPGGRAPLAFGPITFSGTF